MKCKVCGSDSIKELDNNTYVCENCGVEYSKDELSSDNISECSDKNENVMQPKKKTKTLSIKKVSIIATLLLVIGVATIVFITTIFPQIKYNKAIELISNSEFEEAYSILTELGDYKDSKDQIIKSKYNRAVELINTNNYSEASVFLDEIENYQDSEQLKLLVQINTAKVGDTLSFGAYEQDNNIENGKENIDWIVIDKKEDKLLLLSKYCLYAGYYDKSESDSLKNMHWAKSSRREWLNTEFFKEAFSDQQQARILKSDVKSNKDYNHFARDTKDKIFLLSEDEVSNYLTSENKKAEGTPYAKKKGAADNGYCYWWTRTTGAYEHNVTCVDPNGEFNYLRSYDELYMGIRPAIWITTSKDVTPPEETSEYIGSWTGKDSFSEETVQGLNLTIHKVVNSEIVFDYASPYVFNPSKNVTAKLDSNGSYSVTLPDGITLTLTLSYDKIHVMESDMFSAMQYDFYMS